MLDTDRSSNMRRSPLSADETGSLKKGPWLPEEDDKLISYIHKHGHSSWSALPKLAGIIFKTLIWKPSFVCWRFKALLSYYMQVLTGVGRAAGYDGQTI